MEGQLEAGPRENQLSASDVHFPAVEEADPSSLIDDTDLRVQQALNDSHAKIPASAVLSPTTSNLGACNYVSLTDIITLIKQTVTLCDNPDASIPLDELVFLV